MNINEIITKLNDNLPFVIDGVGEMFADGTVRKYNCTCTEYELIKQVDCNAGYVRYNSDITVFNNADNCSTFYKSTTGYKLVIGVKGFLQDDLINKIGYLLTGIEINKITVQREVIAKVERMILEPDYCYLAFDFNLKENKNFCNNDLPCIC